MIEASKQSLVPVIPKLHNITHFDKLMSEHIKEYDTVSKQSCWTLFVDVNIDLVGMHAK